ncbi:MAG: 4Fe-4S double cluster binding domain-containing protein [Spirochaetota bacterium]
MEKAGAPCFPVRLFLGEELSARGFFSHGFLSRAEFLAILEREGRSGDLREYLGDGFGGLAAVALRYGEGEYGLPGWASGHRADPSTVQLSLGRFCRADWYGEILQRLRLAAAAGVSRAAAAGVILPPARMWKRLANSRLPEKSLALAAGLGFLGRNSILIARRRIGEGPSYSSAVVLGFLLCPEGLDFEAPEKAGAGAPEVQPGCGSCSRCIAACPTGALGEGGGFIREKCIQHWTSRDESPPGEVADARGLRLYGCDSCLEACPYFLTDPGAQAGSGRLGPGIPVPYFLASTPEKIQADLKGSALGPRWISKKSFKRFAEGFKA